MPSLVGLPVCVPSFSPLTSFSSLSPSLLLNYDLCCNGGDQQYNFTSQCCVMSCYKRLLWREPFVYYPKCSLIWRSPVDLSCLDTNSNSVKHNGALTHDRGAWALPYGVLQMNKNQENYMQSKMCVQMAKYHRSQMLTSRSFKEQDG